MSGKSPSKKFTEMVAIAYAIFDYINYHGDNEYLVDYGLEVLIAISRFWAQRCSMVERQGAICDARCYWT